MKGSPSNRRWPSLGSSFIPHPSSFASVVAWNGFNGSQNLLVRQFLSGSSEAGVSAIEKQGKATIGVTPKRGEQMSPFDLSKRAEIHDTILLAEGNDPGAGDARKVSSVATGRESPSAGGVVGVPEGRRARDHRELERSGGRGRS